MDPLTRFDASVTQAHSIVAQIPVSQYASPTPCPDWDAGEVVNHMLQALVMFREAGEKGTVDIDLLMSDHHGSDAAAALRRIGDEAVAAWSAPGKLEEIAHLPIGDLPAGLAVQMPAMDLVVHGWDLVQATGVPVAWNEELVDDTYAFVTQTFSDPQMRGDSFAPPVAVASDAGAMDQLVAFLGRTPV